jgi:hypothetical protein
MENKDFAQVIADRHDRGGAAGPKGIPGVGQVHPLLAAAHDRAELGTAVADPVDVRLLVSMRPFFRTWP